MNARVLHIAAPLTTRSGVHNSLREAVLEARSQQLDWHGLLGMRTTSTTAMLGTHDSLTEFTVTGDSTRSRLHEVGRVVDDHIERVQPDVLISWLPQTDVVLARQARRRSIPWVAYLRAQPWPSADEVGRMRSAMWKMPELLALSRADAIWASTKVLSSVLPFPFRAKVVAPGLRAPSDAGRERHGENVVWAGRYEIDKDPFLFLEIMRRMPQARGVMFGHGPLEAELRRSAPSNTTVFGWATPEETRARAVVVVCTSRREGFGRTAVEACMVGLPVVIGAGFGAEPLLFTDDKMRALSVVPSSDPEEWASAVMRLLEEPSLRRQLADHVKANSSGLLIEAAVSRISEELTGVVAKSPSSGHGRGRGWDAVR